MSSEKDEHVTFIGLGIMGSRMTANLVTNGVPLTVYNRSKEPREQLAHEGACIAGSYREAVEVADVVFTMLSTPEVVAEIAFGNEGFLQDMKEDALWVDCTTVNPSFSIQSQGVARKHGVRFIDAPVAGTKPQAEMGDLLFFVGAEERDLDQIGFYLNIMGKKIIHVGKVGQGACFKMLVNALLGQAMVAFSETVLLGEKLGISRNFLLDTLPDMAVSAPFTRAKAEKIRNEDYEVQFPLEWMHKDMHLVTQTAYERGQPLYLVNLAKELFAGAKQSGLAREDFSAIYRFLSRD
jgi:3-hydroxyisobutyrate dehydrogenase-like beta-hydroxyacid dehydrogenase